MPATLKATGAWARMVTDNGTVALAGGSPASGNRMFLFGAWKDFAITATVSGWTPITSFADGSTNAGNGTGSVTVAAWYRDWVSGDTDPVIDYSAAPTEGHWVVQLWQKASGDAWDAPTFVTAAITANDPWSATSSGTITIKAGAVVFELVGLRDDSSTIARDSNTALDDDGSPAVTWNGNIVESPATHFSSTTGLDMSGDLIHRLVTSGGVGVNLTTTGDPAAAETGACLWVHQGVTGQTVTVPLATLATSGKVPTITASTDVTAIDSYSESNQSGTSTLNDVQTAIGQVFTLGANGAALKTCVFFIYKENSPTGDIVAKLYAITGTPDSTAVPTGSALATSAAISAASVNASPFALWSFSFAGSPYSMAASTSYAIVAEFTTGTSANTIVFGKDSSSPAHAGNQVDYAGSWSATPTRDLCFYVYGIASSSVTVIPPKKSLTITAYAPQIRLAVIPPKKSLTLTTFAPHIGAGIVPPVKALILTKYAPQLRQSVIPPKKSLVLTSYAPQIRLAVIPAKTALVLTQFVPKVNLKVIPPLTALTLSTFAPTITVSAGDQTVTPDTATLTITAFLPQLKLKVIPPLQTLVLASFAPTISVSTGGAPQTVTPPTATLTLSRFVPTVSTTANVRIVPPVTAVILTEYVPQIRKAVIPPKTALLLETFAPAITAVADWVITPPAGNLQLQGFAPRITVSSGAATGLVGMMLSSSGIIPFRR